MIWFFLKKSCSKFFIFSNFWSFFYHNEINNNILYNSIEYTKDIDEINNYKDMPNNDLGQSKKFNTGELYFAMKYTIL